MTALVFFLLAAAVFVVVERRRYRRMPGHWRVVSRGAWEGSARDTPARLPGGGR